MRDASGAESLALALKFARRDLRGGLKGFRIFLACLILGVAAIAGVGTLAGSITEGLRANGQVILGGDVDIRLTHRPASDEERAWIAAQGRVSEVQTLRAMVRNLENDARTLSELKAVDDAYPLFGALRLGAEGTTVAPSRLLAAQGGFYGVLIEDGLGRRLDLAPGGRVRIGNLDFEVRGVIQSEPDKASQGMALGPRAIISTAALQETGLVQPGSLLRYHYRVALDPDISVPAFHEAAKNAFPDAGWRIQDAANGAPGIKRFVDRVALFLTLAGLTALVVGGVGVGNAVRAYLEGKTEAIATLKCLGASGGFIFRVHYLQVLILALAGSLIGLLLGVGGAALAGQFLSSSLPVPPALIVTPLPLLLALAYGLLTATLFTIWPLARARETPAAALFRDIVGIRRRPRAVYVVAMGLCFLLLVALAILTARETWFAFLFTVSIVGIFGVLILVGQGVRHLARRLPRPRRPALRLALANLHRPGAATVSVVLSMGLGLTLFVTVALIEGNLRRQVQDQLPERAPAFFFIDIQSDQLDDFVATASAIPNVSEINHVPNMRGRIVRVAGTPAEQVEIAPEVRWALRGDRGITYSATPPAGAVIVEGEWWPEDYAGPPLVSLDREVAAGMNIGIGDTLTVNVMGREIEAKIANLREIDWTSMSINFVLVFDHHSLQGAPHSHLATARAEGEAENALFRAVTDRFVNVSVIRMKEALQTVSRLLEQLSQAVAAISSVTLLTGVLVLAGAFAAGHRKRVYDAVILKVLGATRKDIFATFLLEYALLGLITALIAALTGWVAAYLVITRILEATWVSLPLTVVATVVASVFVTLLFGLLGSWRALGEKVAPLLRAE